MNVLDDLLVVVIFLPYFVLWIATLRILFGQWLRLFEWIPATILSLGIPVFLLDTFSRRGETLGFWLVGGWTALPVLVVAWSTIHRLKRRDATPATPELPMLWETRESGVGERGLR